MQKARFYDNFNPRSHERSDFFDCINRSWSGEFQSTLPREERRSSRRKSTVSREFQSTLPREERQEHFHTCFYDFNFNPRSHERSDWLRQGSNRIYTYFNPRSHERSDQHRRSNIREHIQFQSTLPREERRLSVSAVYPYRHFNPRSHERSDSQAEEWKARADQISIHAPTRGATLLSVNSINTLPISIHAPTRGATAILHKKFVYFYTIPTINI